MSSRLRKEDCCSSMHWSSSSVRFAVWSISSPHISNTYIICQPAKLVHNFVKKKSYGSVLSPSLFDILDMVLVIGILSSCIINRSS